MISERNMTKRQLRGVIESRDMSVRRLNRRIRSLKGAMKIVREQYNAVRQELEERDPPPFNLTD